MKRFFAAFLFVLPLIPLFALRSGDKMQRLSDIRWLKGTLPAPAVRDDSGREKYRILTFLLTHTANSSDTLMMLDGLSRRSDVAGIAVITPDPAGDAETLLARLPRLNISFGVDRERKTTSSYMAGSILYPMAFVIDSRDLIVWNGEVVDLPEFLDSPAEKRADAVRQGKIVRKIDELQALMRANESRRMRLLAEEIFNLDPGNAAALRMILFVFENSGRISEAWRIVDGQLAAAPEKARIHYSALDLISRHPVLRRELPGLIERFGKKVKTPEAYDIMVWTLLNRFAFDPAALTGAVRLYEAGNRLAPPAGRDPASAAGHCAAGALLAARLGNFAKAVELQHEAARKWRAAGNTASAADAEKIASYFDLCGKTAVKW